MTKTNKVSMAQWNPLLVAIANKKLEIVRYFLHDLKIAIIHAGKRQGELAPLTKEYAADQEIFSLQLTIANKDLPMLNELWSNFNCWSVLHLQRVVR